MRAEPRVRRAAAPARHAEPWSCARPHDAHHPLRPRQDRGASAEAGARGEGIGPSRRLVVRPDARQRHQDLNRSEEHTSELQSLMRISYAVFCLKKKTTKPNSNNTYNNCRTT